MNNIFANLDQIVYGFFALIVMCYTFSAINQCSKETRFSIRAALVMLMTASSSTLILLVSATRIHWSIGLLIISIALFMAADRRNSQKYFITHTAKRP